MRVKEFEDKEKKREQEKLENRLDRLESNVSKILTVKGASDESLSRMDERDSLAFNH